MSYIYLGIFFCCTGFLLPLGLIMIGLAVYQDYTSKYCEEKKQEKSYKMDEYSGEVVDGSI